MSSFIGKENSRGSSARKEKLSIDLVRVSDTINSMKTFEGNPLKGITPEEWAEHAGMLVAVARDGSGILGSGRSVDELWEAVSSDSIGANDILVQSVPDLSGMTAKAYAELCSTLGGNGE